MGFKVICKLVVSILLVSSTAVSGVAKDLSRLDSYLRGHQVALRFGADSTLVLSDSLHALLSGKMQGKTLLVAADGGSHYLSLNAHTNLLFLRFLAMGSLQYYFVEGARSWAMSDNRFLSSHVSADSFYKGYSAFTKKQVALCRDVATAHPFRYVGIDFERGHGLHQALQEVLSAMDEGAIAAAVKVAPYLTDSTYVGMSAAGFKKHYRQMQQDFQQDSAQLKTLLGNPYSDIAYLLGNPNINTPSGSRDRPMAENLVTELGHAKPGATHLLNCGMAHSRPNIKSTMVNILSQTPELEDRMLVVQLVCDNCTTPQETVSNWAFSFAKGDLMETLNKAAAADIVLYDLSQLPEEFASIRAYGDLLIFARNYK